LPNFFVAKRAASSDNAFACHWHPIFDNLNFERNFAHTVRKIHTRSARTARHHTLADKHKRIIDRAKQNSFAPRNWGPPEMRAKLDAKTLENKPFRRWFCAAVAFGQCKTRRSAKIHQVNTYDNVSRHAKGTALCPNAREKHDVQAEGRELSRWRLRTILEKIEGNGTIYGMPSATVPSNNMRETDEKTFNAKMDIAR